MNIHIPSNLREIENTKKEPNPKAVQTIIVNYQQDMHNLLKNRSKPKSINTEKRTKYEVEMLSAMLSDYDNLLPIEQKDFRKGLLEFINGPYHQEKVERERRSAFLEQWQEHIPSVVKYQNNVFRSPFLPRKNTLEQVYEEFIQGL